MRAFWSAGHPAFGEDILDTCDGARGRRPLPTFTGSLQAIHCAWTRNSSARRALNAGGVGCFAAECSSVKETLPSSFVPLSQQLLDNLSGDVGEAEVAALEAVGEFGMIEAEQMQEGRLQIVHVNRVFDYVKAEIVGFA